MFTKEELDRAWKLANNEGIRYFSSVGSNSKTIKSDKKTSYLTLIMYMAPSTIAGEKYNTCASASEGCKQACLFTAGRGWMKSVRAARIRRTKFFFDHRDEFKKCVYSEIHNHRKNSEKLGKKPAVRLNGTSDIIFERIFPDMFKEFDDVHFYDYSKHWQRFMPKWTLPDNYHLTFSRSESNDDKVKLIMEANAKANVAVVFQELPKIWNGRKVINGDDHDLRILDPKGCIVGLKIKGQASKDKTGFVVYNALTVNKTTPKVTI